MMNKSKVKKNQIHPDAKESGWLKRWKKNEIKMGFSARLLLMECTRFA